MRARCSDSITRDTGVDCLSLYHFDWNTPHLTVPSVNRAQVWYPPAATAVALLSPLTVAGVLR